MRLWSLHPQYLDSKALVALRREGLLAQAVLAGLTRGDPSSRQRFMQTADITTPDNPSIQHRRSRYSRPAMQTKGLKHAGLAYSRA
ncbi:MAG: pyrimidine dimer DNA glycosylase/endonuclease V [Giesbergeria sp.]